MVHEMRGYRQIPTGRLQERLRLQRFYERGLRKDVYTEPGRVEILLRQHIGASPHPTVKQGDRVTSGTLIAEMVEGGLGSSIHASIDGIVSLIDGERIIIEKRG